MPQLDWIESDKPHSACSLTLLLDNIPAYLLHQQLVLVYVEIQNECIRLWFLPLLLLTSPDAFWRKEGSGK
jgi:hypothetical protein